jgi:hypothetical protein
VTTPAAGRRRKPRPLPRQVRPVQNEITVSFVRRLARANHIRPDELIKHLDAWMSTSGRDISISAQKLADASGIDVRRLLQALPLLQVQAPLSESGEELREPQEPSTRRMSAELRLACRRCMAAKGIFSAVTVLAWADKNLCRRHQLWTGHGVTSIEDQADIASIPEIGQAQARISRLARHRGPQGIWHSYRTAEDIIDWSSRESSSQTARQERLRHFLASSATGRLPRSYDHASYYPEVAGVLSVITSPYWQRMAGSGDADDAACLYRRFAASGVTRGDPGQNTPLRGWIAGLRAERYRQPTSKLAQDNDKNPGLLLPST